MVINPKKTILFCWEYGAGLGHIAQLKILARNFDRDKYQLILVNPQGAVSAEFQPFHEVVEFPNTRSLHILQEMPEQGIVSFNATVKSFGFDNSRLVFTRLKLWEKLFSEHAPVLIIGDYAPLAITVARNMGIATVAVGNGYTLPPVNIREYPKFTGQPDPVSGRDLLETFNQALRIGRMKEISCLPEIFKADIQACFTDPNLDPFNKIRNPAAIGPLLKSEMPHVQEKRPEKIFVYLTHCKPETHQLVLEALKQMPIQADIYSLQASSQDKESVRGTQVTFLKKSIRLEEICNNYQLAAHLGGHGFTMELLYAGFPQLIMAKDIEKILVGQAMANNCLAHLIRVDYPRPVDVLVAKLHDALEDGAMSKSISAYSAGFKRGDWQANQLWLMEQINRLI